MNKSGEEAGTESQLTKCMGKALGSIPGMNRLGTMPHICNHRRQQVETGESESHSHPQWPITFETRLGYMRLDSEKQNTAQNNNKKTFLSHGQ